MPVTSTSSTCSPSGSASASGVPGSHGSARTHDPRVVGPELELALGEDHPVGDDAPQRRPLQLHARPGSTAPGQRDGDRGAGAEVPGAADDLARLRLADVDLAELQAVGVRVLARLEHAPDAEEPEVAVRVGDAAVGDALDLGGGDRRGARRSRPRSRRRRRTRAARRRGTSSAGHQNWREKRRSFSQSARRSGRPWRSIAIRSSPRPKAKPETSSGS